MQKNAGVGSVPLAAQLVARLGASVEAPIGSIEVHVGDHKMKSVLWRKFSLPESSLKAADVVSAESVTSEIVAGPPEPLAGWSPHDSTTFEAMSLPSQIVVRAQASALEGVSGYLSRNFSNDSNGLPVVLFQSGVTAIQAQEIARKAQRDVVFTEGGLYVFNGFPRLDYGNTWQRVRAPRSDVDFKPEESFLRYPTDSFPMQVDPVERLRGVEILGHLLLKVDPFHLDLVANYVDNHIFTQAARTDPPIVLVTGLIGVAQAQNLARELGRDIFFTTGATSVDLYQRRVNSDRSWNRVKAPTSAIDFEPEGLGASDLTEAIKSAPTAEDSGPGARGGRACGHDIRRQFGSRRWCCSRCIRGFCRPNSEFEDHRVGDGISRER